MAMFTDLINDFLDRLPPSSLLDGTAFGKLVYWVTVVAAFASMGTFVFFLFKILRRIVRGCIYVATSHFIPGYSIGAVRGRINALEKALIVAHELAESPVKLTAYIGRLLAQEIFLALLTILLAMAPVPPLFRLPLIAGPFTLIFWRVASALDVLRYIRDPRKNGADVLEQLEARLHLVRQKMPNSYSSLADRELDRLILLKQSMMSAGRSSRAGSYGPRDRVFHSKFGGGDVVSVDGDKIEVEFDQYGRKRMMAGFLSAEP